MTRALRWVAFGSILLFCSSPGDAAFYANPNLHYSLTLPEGWVEIPADVISSYSQQASAAAGVPRQAYAAGFQMTNQPWFTYPYILIQHHDVSSSTFREISAAMSEMSKRPSPIPPNELLSNAKFGEPVVDPQHNSIMVPIQMEVAGIGTIKGISLFFPGRAGMVQLNFYSPLQDFDQNWASVQVSLNSLHFDYGFEYSATAVAASKARREGSYPLAKLVGGVLGVMIGLWALRYVRRNR